MQLEVPPLIHHQQTQPLMHPQAPFTHQEFQPPTNIPPGPATVHLESPNRLPPGPTILMAPPHESPIRVGLPVQMMPSGAQIIQVQQHPHGQSVQVVQRIAGKCFYYRKWIFYLYCLSFKAGRVFPNSQIVHQMPYGHVVATGQPTPTIQLQHHPAELKVIWINIQSK
jgi:hypothetical protein